MSALAIVALCVGYTLPILLGVRPLAGHYAWTFFQRGAERYPTLAENQRAPNGDQWAGAFFLALGLLVIWPVAGIAWITGRKGPTLGAEREAELRAARERICELERELRV